jgi:hypothetical protein
VVHPVLEAAREIAHAAELSYGQQRRGTQSGWRYLGLHWVQD